MTFILLETSMTGAQGGKEEEMGEADSNQLMMKKTDRGVRFLRACFFIVTDVRF